MNEFMLQKCAACGAVSWPPRDSCASCWSADLEWWPVSSNGAVLFETTLHSSNDPFFRERLPWRIGIVKLEAGPVAYAHLSAGVAEGEATRLVACTDWRGRGVLIALAAQGGRIEDDPKLKDLTDCQGVSREE
jgi:uncharacterized OB-fold protein